jgi:hypothetical protein
LDHWYDDDGNNTIEKRVFQKYSDILELIANEQYEEKVCLGYMVLASNGLGQFPNTARIEENMLQAFGDSFYVQ